MKVKVTPLNRRFGKYLPGDTFEIHPAAAKVFITKGRLAAAEVAPTYQTRMMTASDVSALQHPFSPNLNPTSVTTTDEAPYGYKADGTPKKRPGRQAKAE